MTKEPRIVAWVDATCYVEGEGYRISFVICGVVAHLFAEAIVTGKVPDEPKS